MVKQQYKRLPFLRFVVSVFVLCLACSFLFIAPARAYTDLSVNCWKAPENITIDADLSEWNKTSAVILNSESQVIQGGNQWDGPEDLSASVYFMWDRDNLYLAAEVVDDTPFMYREGFPPDLVDALVLYFSTDPQADPERQSYQSKDFRLTLIVDDYLFNTGLDREMVEEKCGLETRGEAGDEQILEGYEYAVKEVAGGYIFEAKIPFINFSNEQLSPLVPEEGDVIGFNVGMFDLDFPCPGVATTNMVWTGSEDVDANPSSWGTLVFKGEE